MDLVEDILAAPFDPALVQPQAPPRPLRASPAVRRDKVRGMLLGVGLGDALGAPHEFRAPSGTPLDQYTGALVYPLTIFRRFQGGRLTGSVGQTTDDTEMTIALAGVLTEKHAYNAEAAVAAYLAWAGSKCKFLGYNTRKLFVGVKTIRGYQGRWHALREQPEALWSQSNGCLMRSSPLAVLPEAEWRAAVLADCALSNFHPVCLVAVTAYIRAMRELLNGATPAEATAAALAEAARRLPQAGEASLVVRGVIMAGRDQAERDVSNNKGWVLHALYCAFYALNDHSALLQDRIDRVVRRGGDTDTNAAIAGAMLGALYGEAAMYAEPRTGPNLRILLECDVTAGPLARPPEYTMRRLMELADSLANLG